MTRYAKTLGIALMATLAFSALAASGASAQTGKLTSDGPVTLIGSEVGEPGSNSITMFGSSIACPGSIYTGHKVLTLKETEESKAHQLLPSGSTEGTLTPHLKQENCDAEGFSATVKMSGCDVVLKSGETIGENKYAGSGELQCPPGKLVEVELFLSSSHGSRICTIKAAAQGATGVATISNTEEGVLATGEVTGISGSKSGVCGSEETNEGQIHFSAGVTGINAQGEPTEISVSD